MTQNHQNETDRAGSGDVTPAARWISMLCDESRPRDTVNRLATELGVTHETISRWKTGALNPSRQSILHLRLLVLARKAAPAACEGVWAATDDEWVERVESITHRACVPAEVQRFQSLTREGISALGVGRV